MRLLPDSLVRAAGTLLGLAFYAFDGTHRRIAHRNLAARFRVDPNASEKRSRAARSRTSAGCSIELLKFSTLSDEAMLARVEFDGEDRARLAYAQGRGVLFFTGHFGFWELACARPCAAARAVQRDRAPARQPASSTRCSSTSGSAPATR